MRLGEQQKLMLHLFGLEVEIDPFLVVFLVQHGSGNSYGLAAVLVADLFEKEMAHLYVLPAHACTHTQFIE